MKTLCWRRVKLLQNFMTKNNRILKMKMGVSCDYSALYQFIVKEKKEEKRVSYITPDFYRTIKNEDFSMIYL